MELNNFIENIRLQFEETDVSHINERTHFQELDEWSSLVAMGVISMIDEEYGVDVNGDDIRSSITVNDLFELVKNRL
jgi:acyl carrier protein